MSKIIYFTARKTQLLTAENGSENDSSRNSKTVSHSMIVVLYQMSTTNLPNTFSVKNRFRYFHPIVEILSNILDNLETIFEVDTNNRVTVTNCLIVHFSDLLFRVQTVLPLCHILGALNKHIGSSCTYKLYRNVLPTSYTYKFS